MDHETVYDRRFTPVVNRDHTPAPPHLVALLFKHNQAGGGHSGLQIHGPNPHAYDCTRVCPPCGVRVPRKAPTTCEPRPVATEQGDNTPGNVQGSFRAKGTTKASLVVCFCLCFARGRAPRVHACRPNIVKPLRLSTEGQRFRKSLRTTLIVLEIFRYVSASKAPSTGEASTPPPN